MKRQWVRWSCVILLLVVMVAAGSHLLRLQHEHDVELDAARTYDSHAWALSVSLSELRATQQAYVANGQHPDVWIQRSDVLFDEITSGLSTLTTTSLTFGAGKALGDAAAAVERLRRVDAVAREHTTAGRTLMASDLVFTDGGDLALQAMHQLTLARSAEQETWSRAEHEYRLEQTVVAAAAGAIGLIIALLLGPSIGGQPSQAVVSEDVALEAPPESVPAPIIPDLKLAAAVCTDLVRVSDGAELESALARARVLFNASGLIVWVRDESGRALRPATGHGYTRNTLSRLGRVPCDGDNATAAAYRTMEAQVVRANGDRPGAVVVPLISSSKREADCIGVLSAEVQQGWETSEAVQATAAIVAAQLATLISADPIAHGGDDTLGDGEARPELPPPDAPTSSASALPLPTSSALT